MSQPQHKAESIKEFLDHVSHFTDKWFQAEPTWGPWFRGQSDASKSLRPKLYRGSSPDRGLRTLEDEFRQEFAVRAPSLSLERPQNSWELYFLMQHSGAPTRLLDWTESALIALYFAVRSKSGTEDEKKDAAVWILEPWKLNEYVVQKKEVIAPGALPGPNNKDVKTYEPWLPEPFAESMLPNLPAAVYPTHFQRRISSQRSCFSVHGSRPDGFDELPEKATPFLQKIVIPHSATQEIEKRLAVAGVDELTIFPDLDGLGRWLTTILREESEKSGP
jgi:hypothetical protein